MKSQNRVHLEFPTDALRITLEPLCSQVLNFFNLPDLRLLCFFDDADPADFTQQFGPLYCGFHTPINEGERWPDHISTHFFDSDCESAFDNVIYLRGTTSADAKGSIITFAHELQHFVQFGTSHKVWLANALLYNNLRTFEPFTTARAFDVPIERDAMIVSKRVAEEILGTDTVSNYCDDKIAVNHDRPKWEFFRGLSTTGPFDLLAETKPWVEKYKAQLAGLEDPELDFSKPDWWQ